MQEQARVFRLALEVRRLLLEHRAKESVAARMANTQLVQGVLRHDRRVLANGRAMLFDMVATRIAERSKMGGRAEVYVSRDYSGYLRQRRFL